MTYHLRVEIPGQVLSRLNQRTVAPHRTFTELLDDLISTNETVANDPRRNEWTASWAFDGDRPRDVIVVDAKTDSYEVKNALAHLLVPLMRGIDA